MTEVPYFYNLHNNLGYFSETLPPQAIPISQKNQQWKHECLNTLERIGLKQIAENRKFLDLYSMIEGKLVYSDLVDLPDQLKEVGDIMEEFNLPTYLKHYDILGLVVNPMVAHYMKYADKFVAVSNDEIAENEFKRRRQDLINNYLREELEKELEIRLIEQGYNPDKTDFQSEEERQAYIQEIQARKQAMSPEEIDRYMATGYSTNFVKWANLTLKQDADKFRFTELDRRNLTDFLLTGRCFRHYRIGWDYYKPEYWSPINTFFSQNLETRYVQDGEYVGRVHFYTPSQVINNYGEFLSERQIKKILNHNATGLAGKNDKSPSFQKLIESNFHESRIVPHEQYDDYNFMLQLQDVTGAPMGETTIIGKDGEEIKVPRYFPEREHAGFHPNLKFAQMMRSDLNISSNLIQVTEAYWEGYKRVGELTYRIPETGRIEVAIITEDLLEDFIRENGITKLTNISLEDHAKKSLEEKVNTIAYTYTPVTYEGVKISMFNTDSTDDIYLKCRPCDLQLKGDSNVYANKLPVAGIVDVCLANVIRPYQIGHNLAMNTVQNLSEKEIGILFMFDMTMLPAEYKNFGNSVDEVLDNLVNVARKTGFFPLDASRNNLQGSGGNFNQFSVQNLSLTPQIQNAMNMAQMYKQMAFEQIGLNPAILGGPTKYESATGVQTSQDASFAQMEKYYDMFNDFKKGALEIHLNVAQYAKKNGKDITVFYTDSDMTTAFLEFTDMDITARKLNVYPTSNAKKRRELEDFKRYILSTNTLADDTIALAEFIQTDTVKELTTIAKASLARQMEQQQMNHERQMEQIEAQSQMQDQLNERQFQRQESSKDRDRLTDIQVAEIRSAGRESDNSFQKDIIRQQGTMAALNQKQEQNNIVNTQRNAEISIKRDKQVQESDFRERQLNLKEKELELREREIEGKRFSDIVNKN